MARLFAGAGSDRIVTGIGAGGVSVPSTVLLIARRTSTSGQWESLLSAGASASNRWALQLDTSNQLDYYNGSVDDHSSITFTAADGWCLVGYSIPSTAQPARFHKYAYSSNAWTRVNAASNSNNSNAISGGFGIGVTMPSPYGDFFSGDIAACAYWNRALTDVEIDNLPFTLAAWYASAPKALWVLDQSSTSQKVVDLTGGGADETSISGTSVSSGSVPVFNYADGVWLPTRTSAGGSAVVLDAVLAGAGGIAPDLVVGKPFAVSLAGTGGIAADVKVGKPLAATLAGTSSASGDLTIGGGLVSAVLSALGGIAADLRVGKPLAAVVSATSSAVGDLRVGKALAASLAGTSAAAADLRVGKPLAALLSATSTIQADLRIGKPLAAVLAGACTIAAALTVGAQVVGDKMRMRRGSGI